MKKDNYYDDLRESLEVLAQGVFTLAELKTIWDNCPGSYELETWELKFLWQEFSREKSGYSPSSFMFVVTPEKVEEFCEWIQP